MCPEPMLHSKGSHRNDEAGGLQLESSPYSLQLEKTPCSSEDPAQTKINK